MRRPKLKVFQRADGLFDWHLTAANGRVLCGSVQGYRTPYEARRAWFAVLDTIGYVDTWERAS